MMLHAIVVMVVLQTAWAQCPIGKYNDTSGICKNCKPECYTCEVSNSNCTGCDPAVFKVLQGNTCVCMDHYYADNQGDCLNCHYSCLTCTNSNANNCLTCDSDRFFSANRCFCLPSTYNNATLQDCEPCHSTCLTCGGPDINDCNSCDTSIRVQDGGTPTTCSCIDGTFDDSNYICQPCNGSCLTCQGTATNCLSCDAAQFRSLAGSSCFCISHYFDNGNDVCGICSGRCQNCLGSTSTCTSCPPSRWLDGSICRCLDGTFDNSSTLLCDACTNYCLTCENSSSTCLSCYSYGNRQLYNATCRCLTGYYHNSTIYCQPCHYSCSVCTGPAPSICTACHANANRTLSMGACPCADGFYDNGVVVCLACSSICLTCDSALTCLTCDPLKLRTLVLTDCLCMDGYQQNSSTLLCQPCHYSCLTCFGNQADHCYTCKPLRDYSSYSCPCQSGYYETLQNCYPCDPVCTTCLTSSTVCTSCNLPRVLSGTTCVCASGYYISGTSCQPCSPQCLTCNTSATFCLSCNPLHLTTLQSGTCLCPDGTYKNASYYCEACNSLCQACTGPASTQCQSCVASDHRSLNGSSCPCIVGYYDNGAPLCILCHSNCVGCYGGSDYNCTSCVAGVVLVGSFCKPIPTCSDYLFEGSCVTSCPLGTYPSSHLCLDCLIGCSTCLSAIFCTGCSNEYFLDVVLGTCSPSCLPGNYISASTECEVCPAECSTCILASSSLVCTSCQAGFFLQEGSKCVSACSSGFILVGTICQRCIPNCKTCHAYSVSACITCIPGTYLLGSSCFQVCPYGYQPSGSICTLCRSQCTICYQNKCMACPDGYYLSFDYQCLPLGYFKKGGSLIQCHPNCLSCTDRSFSSCLMCSSRRGDRGQMAISGYCDCWEGSLDTGEGDCDVSAYERVEWGNRVLIGGTQASLYMVVLTSVVTLNFLPTAGFLNYLQLYSSFYYTNSSALLQTDTILKQYTRIHPNTYYRDHNPVSQNKSARLLMSGQTNESLFMRGQSSAYLSQWAFPTIIVTLIVWALAIAIKVLSFLTSKKNSVANLEETKEKKKKFSLKRALQLIQSYYCQTVPIIVFMLTYCEIFTYGIASFKLIILAEDKSNLDVAQMVFSVGVLIYYVGYLFRMLVGCLLGEVKEMWKRKSSLWILFHGYRRSAKQKSHSVFLSFIFIRNSCVIFLIVAFSAQPELQTGLSLAIFTVSFLLNLCFCPWAKEMRIWFHLLEMVMVAQLSVLMYMVQIRQKSRITPSFVLIVLNFFILFLLIGMVITALYQAAKRKRSNKVQPELSQTNVNERDVTGEPFSNADHSYSYLEGSKLRSVNRKDIIEYGSEAEEL